MKKKFRKFKSEYELDKWGNDIWGFWSKDYEKNIYSSVSVYCGWGADHGINDYFRSGHCRNKHYIKEALEVLYAIKIAPRLPENIITYRVMKNKAEKNDLVKNKIIKKTGFVSTSPAVNSLQTQGNGLHIMILELEMGTCCAYVEKLSKRKEFELIVCADLYSIKYKGIRFPWKGNWYYVCKLIPKVH